MPPEIRASIAESTVPETEMLERDTEKPEIDDRMRRQISFEMPQYLRRIQMGLPPDLRELADFMAGRSAFKRLLVRFPEKSAMSIESLL